VKSSLIFEKKKSDIFEDLRIEVVGSDEFQAFWSTILRTGGAQVTKRLFTIQEETCDYIITDEPVPAHYLIKKAGALKKPLVTCGWIYECLLQQKIVDSKAFSAD